MSLALARLGAQVTMTCRNMSKCEAAAEKIRNDENVTTGTVIPMLMDMSSLTSVKNFAEAYQRDVIVHQDKNGGALDMLFLNAGTPFVRMGDRNNGCVPLSEDGIEMVFASNYVGHHLLYRLLEPLLQRSQLARIVQTSSNASYRYRFEYGVETSLEALNACYREWNYPLSVLASKAYAHSKLAQIVWTKKLTRSLGPQSKMYVNAFHPGLVGTSIWDGLSHFVGQEMVDSVCSKVMWTSAEGALTGLYLGVAVDRLVKEDIRGRFFHPIVQECNNEKANDIKLQDDLWEFSDELVKDFLPPTW